MQPILNQAISGAGAKTARRSIMTGATVLMLTGMVAAFGTSPETITYTGKIADVIEQVELPRLQDAERADITGAQAREVRIQRGDTVATLLAQMHVRDAALNDFLRQSAVVEPLFRQLAPGKTITAMVAPTGELESLVFPLNGGKDAALLIERDADGFAASTEQIELQTHVTLQTAVIRHSLFGATDAAGIPDSVATQVADIFGGDIDFHRDLRKGDRLSVIYETSLYLGRPARTQRILAAEFVNDGKAYHAFWHDSGDGTGGYYMADGRSVRKAFLRSPLEFSRITSGFSNARYHPVLKETRAHRGIDYGAPTGTRVKTTGDGTVDFVGTQGGYGKVVMIRHAGDKLTVYGHLSGFASGLKKGQRVSQGEVIGFVGATGIATGPHLHYEFRVGGVHRNPLTVALPQALPLPQSQLVAFRDNVSERMAQIDSIRDMQLVMLD